MVNLQQLVSLNDVCNVCCKVTCKLRHYFLSYLTLLADENCFNVELIYSHKHTSIGHNMKNRCIQFLGYVAQCHLEGHFFPPIFTCLLEKYNNICCNRFYGTKDVTVIHLFLKIYFVYNLTEEILYAINAAVTFMDIKVLIKAGCHVFLLLNITLTLLLLICLEITFIM